MLTSQLLKVLHLREVALGFVVCRHQEGLQSDGVILENRGRNEV